MIMHEVYIPVVTCVQLNQDRLRHLRKQVCKNQVHLALSRL